MGYFAARSAPFGVVPTEVVTAAFCNFAPERVAKALPAAWDVASPSDALRARQESAVAALRRYGVTDDDAGRGGELAEKAARSAPLDGRPLFAANVALDWPDEPVGQVVARGHAAARTARRRACGRAGHARRVRPRVQRAARRGGPGAQEMIMRSRDYDDEQWDHYRERLARRGLLDGDGALTDAGRDLKQRIEDTTDGWRCRRSTRSTTTRWRRSSGRSRRSPGRWWPPVMYPPRRPWAWAATTSTTTAPTSPEPLPPPASVRVRTPTRRVPRTFCARVPSRVWAHTARWGP